MEALVGEDEFTGDLHGALGACVFGPDPLHEQVAFFTDHAGACLKVTVIPGHGVFAPWLGQ
ncbi:MAG: hypothetical protein ABIP20_20900 [Chthoniobacteraceae bacterium]